MKAWFIVCALAATAAGCRDASAPSEPSAAQLAAEAVAWSHFRDVFIDGFFELNPSYAVGQGRHEFDGQIGDWSDGRPRPPSRVSAGGHRGAASVRHGPTVRRATASSATISSTWRAASCSGSRTPTSRTPISSGTSTTASTRTSTSHAHTPTRPRGCARSSPTRAPSRRRWHRSREPANADAARLRRIWHRGFQRLRGVLPGRRHGGLRRGQGRRAAGASSRPSSNRRGRPCGRGRLARGAGAAATQGFALGAERFARMLAATEAVTTCRSTELEAIGRADLARNLAALAAACATFAPGADARRMHGDGWMPTKRRSARSPKRARNCRR